MRPVMSALASGRSRVRPSHQLPPLSDVGEDSTASLACRRLRRHRGIAPPPVDRPQSWHWHGGDERTRPADGVSKRVGDGRAHWNTPACGRRHSRISDQLGRGRPRGPGVALYSTHRTAKTAPEKPGAPAEGRLGPRGPWARRAAGTVGPRPRLQHEDRTEEPLPGFRHPGDRAPEAAYQRSGGNGGPRRQVDKPRRKSPASDRRTVPARRPRPCSQWTSSTSTARSP